MSDLLLTQAERNLQGEARKFARENVSRQLLLDMDLEKVHYPRQYIEQLAAHQLLGLRFPIEVGGRGLTWAEEVLVLEEIGVLGASLACLYSLPSIVGEALHVFGNPEQKQKYLQPILSGQLTVAEALTEPRGGSDFFGATATMKREGDFYILNGQKRFIVGAEGADVFLVYARSNPQDVARKAISTLLVERSERVEVQHVYGLLGTRGGGTGRVYFRDVKVPVANLIGREHGGNEIFNQMMIPERMTSAAGALGLARAALEISTRYADRRKAFGQKIREFEAVSFKIADSLTMLDAARALVHQAAREIDAAGNSGYIRRKVSEAKKFATDTAWMVVNHAMQVMGGIGYTNVYPIERLLRDARLMTIWTGTNEIMDLVIQHEYFRELLSNPSSAREVESDALNAQADGEKIYE
ncbi:MAG: acyl-CoA dehydrogenase [Anaerolineales bacterium]|nr:acyl-CoA dehydrogenase [Anaerolineae bacterium]PWB51140.1 MAG: acyl-CoA dehydrogenase [Anaerolineales bacterium]